MKRLFFGKKGQFYILVALLLVSYAYGIVKSDVPASAKTDAFKSLYQGYVGEGGRAINNAVFEGIDINSSVSSFTTDYLAYSRTVDPAFRLVYLLKNGDSILIGNRLDAAINVTAGGQSYAVAAESGTSVPFANSITLAVGGNSYDFSFSQEPLQLKALFRSSSRLQTRIFVWG